MSGETFCSSYALPKSGCGERRVTFMVCPLQIMQTGLVLMPKCRASLYGARCTSVRVAITDLYCHGLAVIERFSFISSGCQR
jgi:hypothetical protein